MLKRFSFVLGIALLLTSGCALAACGAIPSAYPVLGGTQLEIGNGSTVNNGSTTSNINGGAKYDGTLDAVNASNGSLVSTSPSYPSLDPATFPATGTSNTSASTVGAGSYGTVSVTATTNFTGGTYYINSLVASNNATLNMAAGSYFINTATLGNAVKFVVTSGPVRIYIGASMLPSPGANSISVNAGGSVSNMQVYLYPGATFDLGNSATFVGVIYSPSTTTQIEFGSNSTITGAVVNAGSVEFGANTKLNFSPSVQTEVGNISTCQTTTVTPGRFNAYDTATVSGALSGFIKTKVAGQSFNLDLIAINTAGTAIETTFSGAVKVELLNAADNSGTLDSTTKCRSTWSTVQTLGSNPTFASSDNGRKTVSFTENNAWKDMRVRISYPASGSPTVIGCSTDNFAIRPSSFASVAVTDSDWEKAGGARTLNNVTASGGVVHKAGQPVRVSASAVNAAGNVTTNYTDKPSATPVTCLLPTGCSNSRLGTFTLGTNAVSGVLTDNLATYSEAGAFTLQLVDSSFAAVDASDGSTATERDIVSSVLNVGRFVPDHFDLAPNNTPKLKTFNDATCASRSFTYIGQPFGYVTAPQALVSAKNAAGAITQNYAGDLWKLAAAGVTQTYSSVPASPTLTTSLGTPTITSNGDGTGTISANSADTLTYTRGTSPIAPFNAAISLGMSVKDTAENAASQGDINTVTAAAFNGAGSGIAFDSGNAFRYGRLRLVNAQGSEKLPLNVPVRAEYWNGLLFVANADNCSNFSLTTALALSNWQRNLNAGETEATVSAITLSNGVSAIPLKAPGAGNSGSVDLTLTVPAWLQYNWTGAVSNPKGRATFGIFSNVNEFIYLREAY